MWGRFQISYLAIILLFLSLNFIGCEENAEGEKSPTIAANETAHMIQLIRESVEKMDPKKMSYAFNSMRAQVLSDILSTAKTFEDSLHIKTLRGYELLAAGQNETAIVEYEQLLSEVESKPDVNPILLYNIRRLLALNYYRLSEVNNCIERANDASCIFPIAGEGVFKITQSSERAIQLFEQILKDNPNDFETVWMLNLAYMTLGKYPTGVPSQYRLPNKYFTDNIDAPVFRDVARAKGLDISGLGGGAIADDFNNDGFVDVIASSWGYEDQIRYYENDGKGNFVDKTIQAGLLGVTGGLHLIHADYDNDGYLDFLILRGAWYGDEGEVPNSLMKNNGDGTFTDVTYTSGILSYYPTLTAVWADFNNDGWVDLFIGNESNVGLKNRPCELYLNQGIDPKTGRASFKNVISESGLDDLRGFVKGVTTADINNDGNFDLYISFLDSPNKLLLNMGMNAAGGIHFEDISEKAGIGEPINSFPCWFWDMDNDGWEDIFVSGYSLQEGRSAAYMEAAFHFGQSVEGKPALYKNKGDLTFDKVDESMGMIKPMYTMGSNFGDINNDGFEDGYFGTGTPSFASLLPNKMFVNQGGKTFEDATSSTQLGHLQKGHGVAFADFDRDGDLDIYIVLGGAFEGDNFANALFINGLEEGRNFLSVKLEGTKSNRAALGARLRLRYQDGKGQTHQIMKRVSPGGSFGGNPLTVHFGLANAAKIIDLQVIWPYEGKPTETYTDLNINQRIKITEGQKKVQILP